MTNAQLEKRVEALERAVEELRAQITTSPEKQEPWWITEAGRFANDPVFKEVVRLGREYRESLHPDRKKRKAS